MAEIDDKRKEESFRRKFENRNYVACTRCRSLKIKCSGETPCRSCHNARDSVECIYPIRNRKVSVPESYLRNLQAELNAAKRAKSELEAGKGTLVEKSLPSPGISTQPPAIFGESDEVEGHQSYSDDERPTQTLFVGEAACTTFGNRLLRFLKGDNQMQTQPERYFTDRKLLRMSNSEFELPNRTYGKLLVRSYLQFMGADFHFIPRKQFLKKMDETYDCSSEPQDPLWLCKLFALFALGELYSTRMNKTSSVPGTVFFLKAMTFLQDLYEETTVEYVETLILLSFYSQALNRKNTAYTYAGLALRISLALGLHRKIPPDSPLSPVERESRIRVWWTVYCLDRLYSSKLGHPVMLRDKDIDAQLPSMDGLSATEREEFYDPAYLSAHITLSKITGDIVNELYQIPQQHEQPSPNRVEQSVQKILTTLRSWQTDLPPQAKVDFRATPMYSSRTSASLHLHFGQCVILTTRPIFFQIFRARSQGPQPENTASQRQPSRVALALADACVQAARTSNTVLTQLWVDRCLATFGFFDALSLFSTTLILMMARALRPRDDTTDEEAIETAMNLLKSMLEEGNVPASGYFELLMELQTVLASVRAKVNPPFMTSEVQSFGTVTNATIVESTKGMAVPQSSNMFPFVSRNDICGDGLLDDPFLQDFLSQEVFGSSWDMDITLSDGLDPASQWNVY